LLKGQTKTPIKGNTGILEDLEDYVASKTKKSKRVRGNVRVSNERER